MKRHEHKDGYEIIKCGSVKLYRWKCTGCGEEVLAGDLFCPDCKRPAVGDGVQRILANRCRRRKPPIKARARMLEQQHGKCRWCGRPFGAYYIDGKTNRALRLRIHWDHVLPYSFTQTNSLDNFVAACHVCNTMKSDLIFESERDLKAHLGEKWRRRIAAGRYEFVDPQYNNPNQGECECNSES